MEWRCSSLCIAVYWWVQETGGLVTFRQQTGLPCTCTQDNTAFHFLLHRSPPMKSPRIKNFLCCRSYQVWLVCSLVVHRQWWRAWVKLVFMTLYTRHRSTRGMARTVSVIAWSLIIIIIDCVSCALQDGAPKLFVMRPSSRPCSQLRANLPYHKHCFTCTVMVNMTLGIPGNVTTCTKQCVPCSLLLCRHFGLHVHNITS